MTSCHFSFPALASPWLSCLWALVFPSGEPRQLALWALFTVALKSQAALKDLCPVPLGTQFPSTPLLGTHTVASSIRTVVPTRES